MSDPKVFLSLIDNTEVTVETPLSPGEVLDKGVTAKVYSWRHTPKRTVTRMKQGVEVHIPPESIVLTAQVEET